MRRSSSRTPRRGFTLLEVMAAVAILGILYVTLMRVSIQGIIDEGEGRRRLEASLLADDQLARLELQASLGQPPPLGERDFEIDGFKVTVTTAPFQLPSREEDPTTVRTETPQSRAAAESLRVVELRVEPVEGGSLNVSRVTWALDLAVYDGLIEARESPGGGGGGDDADGIDGATLQERSQ